ncbi:MAG: MerR family transcriptional regulator [Phycisphaeraceae bacterium]|nr:MerR family transcriptional regulator [Phycisphaeraceae bacterium]
MAQLTHDHAAWLNDGRHDAPPKRYRIGELARHTGLTRQTLHNYTRWGLIKEAEWTPGGHRLYDEAVFTRLSKILRLRKQHTVEEMKALLDPARLNLGRDAGGMVAEPCVEKGAAD